MFTLAHQSEIERLDQFSKMWSQLEPSISDPEAKLLQNNLLQCVKFYKDQESAFKAGDLSIRFLTESLLPDAVKTPIILGLEENKEKSLTLIEENFKECIIDELDKITNNAQMHKDTIVTYISPYQLESVLRTAIMTVGEPTNTKDYLTYKLADLALSLTTSNAEQSAIHIEDVVHNVGLLGKQVKLNKPELINLKNTVNTTVNNLKAHLGTAETITSLQNDALKEVRKILTDLSEYVKDRVIKTEGPLSQGAQARFANNTSLQGQVLAINEALNNSKLTEASFNGLRQTAYFVSQLGQFTNSKELLYVGQAISAGAQISQGITQLTGTAISTTGTAISALLMLAPMSNIALGGLALYGMLSRPKSQKTDPIAIYLNNLSTRIDKHFNVLNSNLERAFNNLTGTLVAAHDDLIKIIYLSQQNVINQVRLISHITTQQLSEKFDQGWAKLMDLSKFMHTEVAAKLTEIITHDLNSTVNSIEHYDYADNYFTGMSSDNCWIIQYNVLLYWAREALRDPVMTGAYLTDSISSFTFLENLKFKQSLIKTEPTFMIGWLLSDKNIDNPYIWLRAVRAYIKLVIARPDFFSDKSSLDKDVNTLKDVGVNIVNCIKSACDSLCKVQTYSALLDHEAFGEYLKKHLKLRSKTFLEHNIPKNELDQFKRFLSYIEVNFFKYDSDKFTSTGSWVGKNVDFTNSDTIAKLTSTILSSNCWSGTSTIIDVLNEFQKLFFEHAPSVLKFLIQTKLIEFMIILTVNESTLEDHVRIELYVDNKTLINLIPFTVSRVFSLHDYSPLKGPAEKILKEMRQNSSLLSILNQKFCVWFNEHVTNGLNDVLSVKVDPLWSSDLTPDESSKIQENREIVSLLLATGPYIQKLKACFPYIQNDFVEIHSEEVIRLLLDKAVVLKPHNKASDDDDDQFDLTSGSSVSQPDTGFYYVDNYNGHTLLDIFESLHDIFAKKLLEDVDNNRWKVLLHAPMSWGVSIDQEVSETLHLLELLPAYVQSKQTTAGEQPLVTSTSSGSVVKPAEIVTPFAVANLTSVWKTTVPLMSDRRQPIDEREKSGTSEALSGSATTTAPILRQF